MNQEDRHCLICGKSLAGTHGTRKICNSQACILERTKNYWEIKGVYYNQNRRRRQGPSGLASLPTEKIRHKVVNFSSLQNLTTEKFGKTVSAILNGEMAYCMMKR